MDTLGCTRRDSLHLGTLQTNKKSFNSARDAATHANGAYIMGQSGILLSRLREQGFHVSTPSWCLLGTTSQQVLLLPNCCKQHQQQQVTGDAATAPATWKSTTATCAVTNPKTHLSPPKEKLREHTQNPFYQSIRGGWAWTCFYPQSAENKSDRNKRQRYLRWRYEQRRTAGKP